MTSVYVLISERYKSHRETEIISEVIGTFLSIKEISDALEQNFIDNSKSLRTEYNIVKNYKITKCFTGYLGESLPKTVSLKAHFYKKDSTTAIHYAIISLTDPTVWKSSIESDFD